ncbi:unnamed protein product, partial [Brachionus calyciflorus]
TSLVIPHLEYAVQVWNPIQKKEISDLEGVQRRATKIITELRNLSYQDRLKKIELTNSEERRMRGDLIEQIKKVKKLDIVDWHHRLRNLSESYNTRSHN